MVKREGLVDKLSVTADGAGQVGHAGSALLLGTADRVGLTRLLSGAMAPTRKRRSAHDPGVVLRGLAVMLADGGDCLGDLGALRDQLDLYGNVASDATAFRVIDSIDEQALMRLRTAVATARARAWTLGARPERTAASEEGRAERTVIDIDAMLTTAHYEKEQAHGNFKGGYGHHWAAVARGSWCKRAICPKRLRPPSAAAPSTKRGHLPISGVASKSDSAQLADPRKPARGA